ncbi:hypothetical protein [Massilia niastensis]|uniref:hypothetical protein n=1 Tax=Massilia niastensis TaxID=544911 RepID=UPI0012EB2BB5|nr:hypothetical protein [Massilia niastensis]
MSHAVTISEPTSRRTRNLSARTSQQCEGVVFLHSHPHRRTLQRWLADFIDRHLVRREGDGRASRYFLVQAFQAASDARIEAPGKVDFFIPLSEGAKEVEAYVTQPVQRREPVGYNRAFLDAYRANETCYLPQGVRVALLKQGQAVAFDEPAGTYARRIAHRLPIDLSWNTYLCSPL